MELRAVANLSIFLCPPSFPLCCPQAICDRARTALNSGGLWDLPHASFNCGGKMMFRLSHLRFFVVDKYPSDIENIWLRPRDRQTEDDDLNIFDHRQFDVNDADIVWASIFSVCTIILFLALLFFYPFD
jgi:hypothetical protein